MAKESQSKESKTVSIFSIFRCCMGGNSRPKVQKKGEDTPANADQKDSGVEEGKQAIADANYSVQTDDLELEYKPSPEDRVMSLSDDYKPNQESESTVSTSTAPSTVGADETDASFTTPGNIQVVSKDGTSSGRQAKEIGTGGRLNFKFVYAPEPSKLTLYILGIEFPPFQNWKMEDLEVSCMLLPIRQHSFRARPKKFKDPFSMVLTPKNKIGEMSLRFRLYDHRAMSKHLIGQGFIKLGELTLGPQELTLALDLSIPETYAIDSRYIPAVAGETQTPSEDSKPEILISLEYRSLTRKLIVEVIKTRNLGLRTNSKPQDIAVEIKLIGENKQPVRICRTSMKRHVIDAEFNEMFMFRVTYEKLANIGLVFVLYRQTDKRGKRENIGEVCFGKLSSSHQQQNHWSEIAQRSEKVITQWHPLFK